MPTNSNESLISSSTTTLVVPSMNTSMLNATNNNSGPSSSSSNTNHMQASMQTRPNSPPQAISRQLNKLKRFFSTLYYFGSDISNEIGERVRTLILALINNALSVEEFHGKVQVATSFPLRPFALPFLKSTLPLLQSDLSQLARQSKQSSSHYLAQHEELILLPRDILERSASPSIPPVKEQMNNDNTKRKLPDDAHEHDERSYSGKRSAPNLNNNNNTNATNLRSLVSSTVTKNVISSTSIRRDIRDKERTFTSYLRDHGPETKDNSGKAMEDDWRNTENMLNCILEMVTKTKRVLFMLQQKDNHLRRLVETNDLEWRRRHAEMLTQTEDRIVEVRRKAEEAVLEIKRQSIVDLQKAVSQAEQKSNEILLREREQYQRLNQELKAQTFEEAYALLNRQEDGPEQCWHCARRAIETCSGCNIARYCGQYCQHRDWDSHQKLCGPDLKRKLNDNPQLYRSSFTKIDLNISLNNQIETSINNTSTRTSETAADTPYLSVSTPIMADTPTSEHVVLHNDDKYETEERTTVKTEHT
ncbi:unnamed protein product [Rotaria socialis]|uniref:Uncharacterized protein n=1 Tax=Rotaria socialis TaxID=392032 RepID=A0A818DFE5_9BILA|nr:unnamed protein product [Rotaria socialis]CAF3440745.1 unnamed protein product [Rotaria socialis]CAF3776363.1 unnamed protein product [Rotaria socialis]CAF4142091.1 unnamed protein product [Rotaria socialis]CAF4307763.1 unnamed protein product [Rotaria socialis]